MIRTRAVLRAPALGALVALPLLLPACGGSPDADAASSSASADQAPASTAARADAASPAAGARTSATDLPLATSDDPNTVVVYKSPACGCCSSWVEHLEANGFEVEAHERADMAEVKNLLGVPDRLRSCHTALVDGYLVEGHVPASSIRRLLEEETRVAGLAVPGMPVGSPGMEVPGRPADPYDVLAFDGAGEVSVFEKH